MAPCIDIILGTRPEAIKLAPVIQQFRACSHLTTRVILTGQHREMVDQVMGLFAIAPDQDLAIMQPRQSLTDITCRTLEGLSQWFDQDPPDCVLVQGDTTTAFAAALAAFYRQIPIGHVEAGLRTDELFNPYPEEANRRLISQIAQLHFAPTTVAVENLRKSGVTGAVHHTGNTVIDALLRVAATEPACNIPGLDWQQYRVILTTVHRRENWGAPLRDILAGITMLLDQFPDTAFLLPMHRNPTVREPIQAALGNHPRVFLTEPLDYGELVGAIQRCHLVLTDSGGLQEEAPSLGKPVLVLRETTERPEALQAGTARLIGTDGGAIAQATTELLTNSATYATMANAINPFGDGTAAAQILAIVDHYLQEKGQ
ncbi:UDP-N-acetylglucosamine 2-epimerase (non-hydrolyzing) [Spirulina sp. CCNP1310]|uniref:non-hydrolyzing UDP-N-acetylglucosamine 2-epimerase n=1 Tax=Spirulina sp. CCNP1310 TaxID=3110249 RepID=UPI002B206BB3|nr:UDP-N-acetylglucosamine 2-epimerase (non-hydrolyzing) [Spirulina sp. CCNP1310]MEA5418659.1 UDP-N-acetylglucosamine 2-epimerase (non-hydrolyzing) [Spirulina sp. CCNP1310]